MVGMSLSVSREILKVMMNDYPKIGLQSDKDKV